MKGKIIPFLFLFLPAFFAKGQATIIDSLLLKLKNSTSDSASARICNKLGFAYYRHRGELDSALYYIELSLKKIDKSQPTLLLANIYCNRALMFREKGIYDKGLENYLEGLKTAQSINDDKMRATAYNGIGITYAIQHENVKAREYYFKCLEIYNNKKSNSYRGAAGAFNNIGLSYFHEKNYPEAQKYYEMSLSMNTQNNDLPGIATASENLGLVYNEEKEYAKANVNFQNSLKIWRQLNDINSQAITLGYVANSFTCWGKPQQAVDTCIKALDLSIKAGSVANAKDVHGFFYEAYEKLKNADKALFHYKEYRRLDDSLNNSEKTRELAEMQAGFKYDQQRVKDSLQLQLTTEKNQLVLKQEKYFRYGLLIVLFFVLGFMLMIWKSLKEKKKSHALIALQKKMVEEKNKEVFDSISYAKNLQNAILPSPAELANVLEDYFVFYVPKDIVSGDFYWIAEKDDHVFYATVDCTGHGVPGGFMSMLGTSMLNEIVNEKRITEPADILDLLRIKIIKALNQTTRLNENKDGMDMVVCRLDKKKTELVYAGANNPLWIVRDNAVMKYLADKQPVGIAAIASVQFHQHVIPLKKKDVIYTFSDGYADQFGGPKGKKFKYKQLEQVLLANHGKAMEEQKEILGTTLENWKGPLEQVDDILVIGVRV